MVTLTISNHSSGLVMGFDTWLIFKLVKSDPICSSVKSFHSVKKTYNEANRQNTNIHNQFGGKYDKTKFLKLATFCHKRKFNTRMLIGNFPNI